MAILLIIAGLCAGLLQLLFAIALGKLVLDGNAAGAKLWTLIVALTFGIQATLFFCAGSAR